MSVTFVSPGVSRGCLREGGARENEARAWRLVKNENSVVEEENVSELRRGEKDRLGTF